MLVFADVVSTLTAHMVQLVNAEGSHCNVSLSSSARVNDLLDKIFPDGNDESHAAEFVRSLVCNHGGGNKIDGAEGRALDASSGQDPQECGV